MADSSLSNSPQEPQAVLSHQERREYARFQMQTVSGIGKFMYLLHSPYVRITHLPDYTIVHSVIDVVNILSDSENEPRKFWSDSKKRMIRDDPKLSEKIRQLPLPAWTDGKRYRVDVATASALLIIVFELHTPLANELRHFIADVFDQYDNRHNPQIIAELERTSGWAATRNHVDLLRSGALSDPELYKPDSWNDIIGGSHD